MLLSITTHIINTLQNTVCVPVCSTFDQTDSHCYKTHYQYKSGGKTSKKHEKSSWRSWNIDQWQHRASFFLSRPFSVWILREFLTGFDRVFHLSSGSAGFPWCWLWHSRNCVWWLRQPELKKNLSFSGSTPSSLSYDSNTITTFSSRADRTNLRSRLHLHLHLIAFIRRKGNCDKSRKPTLSPRVFCSRLLSLFIPLRRPSEFIFFYVLLCRAGPGWATESPGILRERRLLLNFWD